MSWWLSSCDLRRCQCQGVGNHRCCSVEHRLRIEAVVDCLHLRHEYQSQAAGCARHDGEAADQRLEQQRVSKMRHNHRDQGQQHCLVHAAQDISALREVLAAGSGNIRQRAGTEEEGDLHAPEHIHEDAASAAPQLLDLDACSVRRLSLVLGVKRRHNR
eukprot:scaffold246_cov242-Pinguiococcus_pyrenoidosus.AAC.22